MEGTRLNRELMGGWRRAGRGYQDAIMVCDLNEHITYLNEQAALLYGVPQGDAIGRPAGEILRQPKDSPDLRTARRLLKAHGEWSGTLEWRTPEGSATTTSCLWTLVRDGNDAPMSILIVGREAEEKPSSPSDDGHRKHLETLGSLAVGIAHHLNDMIGPALLQVDRIAGRSRNRKTLESLRSVLEESANLVSQILTFSQDNRVNVPVQPDLLVRSLEGFLRKTLPKSIEIRLQGEESLPEITVDGARLFNVLLDLSLRAERHLSQNGSLVVSVSTVAADPQWAKTMNFADPGGYVALTIGTGPDAGKKKWVTARSLAAAGKDPDLTELTEEVKALGGFLRQRVDRDVLEFQLFFPTSLPEEREPTECNPARVSGKGEMILVVDDEPAIRESTRMTLIASGYRVLTASDGAEGVSLYAEHSEEISAVLMDIMMPFMSGDTAIRAILQINPKARIIAASGYSTSEKLAQLVDLDRVTMIQKPYTSDTLHAALSRVLRESSESSRMPANSVFADVSIQGGIHVGIQKS